MNDVSINCHAICSPNLISLYSQQRSVPEERFTLVTDDFRGIGANLVGPPVLDGCVFGGRHDGVMYGVTRNWLSTLGHRHGSIGCGCGFRSGLEESARLNVSVCPRLPRYHVKGASSASEYIVV